MKIGLVFPGYGSQYVGMAKELYDESRIMQEFFEEASSCLNKNFVKLCFASSDAELSKAENAYPAIFLVSCAIARMILDQKIFPQQVAGYGLGQVSAVYAAEGITFPDGLYMLSKYAYLYQDLLQEKDVSLLAIKEISFEDVEALRQKIATPEKPLYIAVYGVDGSWVIAGNTFAVREFEDLVIKITKQVKYLPLEYGLFSPLNHILLNNLSKYAQKVDFHDLKFPLISGVDGRTVSSGNLVKESFLQMMVSPFRWDRIVNALNPLDVIIIPGPGQKLGQFLQNKYPQVSVFVVEKPENFEEIQSFINQ